LNETGQKIAPAPSLPHDGVAATVSIRTHGCKLNQSDSEALARRFREAGYRVVGPSDPADVCILNTCTVTHVADRKARRALRSAHRQNPSALVVATGCYAQRAPAALAGMAEVGLVAGNGDKDRLVELVAASRGNPIAACATGDDPAGAPVSWRGRRTRAMVQIQTGCDQVCAYCIVPKVRGRERSVPPGDLLIEVRRRVEEGYKEVVLTGTQLGSYGFDLPGTRLRDMLELLLKESGVERLRVSSLQPQELTQELLELWDDTRLCPHFHMPLQSGSAQVLQRMRRRYTAREYAAAVEMVRARVPGAAVTADVIVGFPGEDEDHFRESLRFAERMEFASMHVFPYSARPGTSAAYMGPQVDEGTKRSRMDEMLTLAAGGASRFRRRCIGSIRPVLWERTGLVEGKRVLVGLTDSYLKVLAEEGSSSLLNRVTPARLVAEAGDCLLAEVIQPG
jgi:threonylcarbamoyladenosine tRNA methylthiotransferase MtaB